MRTVKLDHETPRGFRGETEKHEWNHHLGYKQGWRDYGIPFKARLKSLRVLNNKPVTTERCIDRLEYLDQIGHL